MRHSLALLVWVRRESSIEQHDIIEIHDVNEREFIGPVWCLIERIQGTPDDVPSVESRVLCRVLATRFNIQPHKSQSTAGISCLCSQGNETLDVFSLAEAVRVTPVVEQWWW